MCRIPSLNRVLFGILMVSVSVMPATRVDAQTTTWVGTTGDWSTASNWSNGEPAAGLDAEVLTAATPTVTQGGEVCRNLTLGVTVGGANIQVNSGSLSISQRLLLSSTAGGTMTQAAGAVSAGEVVIGNPAGGAYTMRGGTMDLATARIGRNDAGSSGSYLMAQGSPVCTIADSLVVERSGTFNCGAGTLNVGTVSTGGAWVSGVFAMSNNPSIAMAGFSMSETGRLSVAVGASGVSTMVVSGTATLAGQLLVTDIGAANGTYEVLRGNPLQGTFEAAFLSPDWSWRVEGNSLLLIKGTVAVESRSWGALKTIRD